MNKLTANIDLLLVSTQLNQGQPLMHMHISMQLLDLNMGNNICKNLNQIASNYDFC